MISDEEADSPRDSVFMRWLKFAAIIVVLALLTGGFFGISIYVGAVRSSARFDLDHSARYHISGNAQHNLAVAESDTGQAFKQRFYVGSFIGGAVGVFYVIRCLVRREDP